VPETAVRDRSIIEHVRAYPGLTATQIARALRESPTTVLKALRRMLAAGVVAAEEGRRTPEDWRTCTRWRPAAGLAAGWLA
jgi:hypothetical protein